MRFRAEPSRSATPRSYYYWGKDPALTFGTALPFGLNSRQMYSWLHFGGGNELLNELLKNYNCFGTAAANTGAQMGGWFRKEIKSVDDIKGLKMRIGGFAGTIVTKIGVVPQQLAGGDIYPALEKGTIDACEWIGPYDDEKLGFNKVARYYYYPGWWEGCGQAHNIFNLTKWNELPKNYQAALLAASHESWGWVLGKYDAGNPPALRRLVAGGAQLRAFPQDVMEACYKAVERDLRRHLQDQRAVQEAARQPHGFPQRQLRLDAGRRDTRSTVSRCACARVREERRAG